MYFFEKKVLGQNSAKILGCSYHYVSEFEKKFNKIIYILEAKNQGYKIKKKKKKSSPLRSVFIQKTKMRRNLVATRYLIQENRYRKINYSERAFYHVSSLVD